MKTIEEAAAMFSLAKAVRDAKLRAFVFSALNSITLAAAQGESSVEVGVNRLSDEDFSKFSHALYQAGYTTQMDGAYLVIRWDMLHAEVG